MARLDESILEFIRRNGPSTPIEVAQRVGVNSIIVTAVLVDAVSQRKLLHSKRKFGSMKLYYLPGQEQALQKRVGATLTPQDRELLNKLMKENVIGEFEVGPNEAAGFSSLEDLVVKFTIDFNGKMFKCWAVPQIGEQKAKEIAMNKLVSKFGGVQKPVQKIEPPVQKDVQPAPQVIKPEVKVQPKPVQKEKSKKPKARQEILPGLGDKFKDNVLEWFEKQNIDVESEKVVKEKKEYELKIKIPTPIGRQTYFVRIINTGKKKVGQSELSEIGMDAITKRTPAIVISRTGFAKNAKKYWEKELKDMVTLVSEEDLE